MIVSIGFDTMITNKASEYMAILNGFGVSFSYANRLSTLVKRYGHDRSYVRYFKSEYGKIYEIASNGRKLN